MTLKILLYVIELWLVLFSIGDQRQCQYKNITELARCIDKMVDCKS